MDMNTELYEKLAKLQWLLQRQHLKTHAAVGPMADTSRGQGRILAFLRMKDGISTKDLSYMLDIRVSSLNELLAKLEKAEYITRKPSETDKRIMLIYLTQKGQEEEGQEIDNVNIFSSLSSEEQVAFGDYLTRVIMALEEELGTDGERDVMAMWMEAAKERMGTEEFEKLMAMRGQMQRMWGNSRDERFSGRFPGFGGEGHRDMRGFVWPSRDGRNSSPDKSPDSDDK
ncbi:DNA-binding MarR family transcriptional regulator [Paenibacillus sp. PastF-3]|uniref:MarR family winged helix-turn-helix transcriptional regulator n=1 Tax=unclassified Paenibacillus TaxID=185978 RepID=UPI000B9FA965|nr:MULTISPECIES: MarR family transcriptional regulator [unclassified Paenibacillus]MDH6368845.1 DNA-binding MarR family transcriptional regulator [Paenibacillus sp. PastF-3]